MTSRWTPAIKWAGVLVGVYLAGAIAFRVLVEVMAFSADELDPATICSTTILDSNGAVLQQRASVIGGRQTWVALSQISPHVIHATIASEDRRFYSHHGVDFIALARAAWLDLRARRGDPIYGGSTIAMQLGRLLDPPSPGKRRTLASKLRQIGRAFALGHQLDREEILEQYLNRAFYGHGMWGIEAAARFYFGKPALALSAGESAFLAVLPRGPETYHPFRHFEKGIARRHHIFDLMVARGYLSPEGRAVAEALPLDFHRNRPGLLAPHFVERVLASEQKNGAAARILKTTLDAPLQTDVEEAVRQHVRSARKLGIDQAGVVVLRNRDGSVVAYVGSADYFDWEGHGAVDVLALAKRPGSTLKPFVYGLALEQGDTPASMAYDVMVMGPGASTWDAQVTDIRDMRQHGFARYRVALASSYNLAAIHTLERVGLDNLVERLRKAGLTTLTRKSYTPGLAIGDAEVNPVELAAAFSAFARGGEGVAPRWLEDAAVISRRIFSPEVAYLVFDMLSDEASRKPMFGDELSFRLPYPVAIKTGTTRAYTDNYALGSTNDYTIAVWAGNFDDKTTHHTMAAHGAAPLLRQVLVAVGSRFGVPSERPTRPESIEDGHVCALSGMAPGPYCPGRKHEQFVSGTVPSETCTWHDKGGAVRYPQVLEAWAAATQAVGAVKNAKAAPSLPTRAEGTSTPTLRIVYPGQNARFFLDPFRPAKEQVPPLRASGRKARRIRWTIDGTPAERWLPTPGTHVVRARVDDQVDEVSIRID